MFPIVLPSIARLTPTFHPKFADLATTKRPAGRTHRASAVSIEAAQRKTRIRKRMVTDVNLDFMAAIRNSFLAYPTRGNFRHSLDSPLCSCISITLPSHIVDASLRGFGRASKVAMHHEPIWEEYESKA